MHASRKQYAINLTPHLALRKRQPPPNTEHLALDHNLRAHGNGAQEADVEVAADACELELAGRAREEKRDGGQVVEESRHAPAVEIARAVVRRGWHGHRAG